MRRRKSSELDHPPRGGWQIGLANSISLLVSTYELRERRERRDCPALTTGRKPMAKAKSFEVLVQDGRSKNDGGLFWRVVKRSNFTKHRANGNPMRVVWTGEDGKRTGKVLFNQENLVLFGLNAADAAVA